jgi:hypothetical protein
MDQKRKAMRAVSLDMEAAVLMGISVTKPFPLPLPSAPLWRRRQA